MEKKYVVFKIAEPSGAPCSKASIGIEESLVCPCCLTGKVSIRFSHGEAISAYCNKCNRNLVVVDCIED